MSIAKWYATSTLGKTSIGEYSKKLEFLTAEDEIFSDEVGNPFGELVQKRMGGILFRKTFWE